MKQQDSSVEAPEVDDAVIRAPIDAERRSRRIARGTGSPATLGPPRWRGFVIAVMVLAAATVYLFITAPPPLASEATRTTIPIGEMFGALAAENDVVRAMWTQEIVARGKLAGLAFNEAWRDKDVDAGPLPALFLRETARELERHPERLSLFLGSEFPVNAANRFSASQTQYFRRIQETAKPQFFFDPETRRSVAMFPDVAVAEACVTCHNNHDQSPRHDWKLHDIMGATTWMYPDQGVTAERALTLIANLRGAVRAAYATYLTKVATFQHRPEIGTKWPRDGFFLPSVDVFMAEIARRASPATLRALTERARPTTDGAPAAAPPAADATPPAADVTPPRPPDPPTGSATPPRPDRPAATDSIVIVRADATTSIEIEDADARLLVRAGLPAGGSCQASGRPPFVLRVGNPDAIHLDLDGKRVDLDELKRRVRRAKSVELRIGSSADRGTKLEVLSTEPPRRPRPVASPPVAPPPPPPSPVDPTATSTIRSPADRDDTRRD